MDNASFLNALDLEFPKLRNGGMNTVVMGKTIRTIRSFLAVLRHPFCPECCVRCGTVEAASLCALEPGRLASNSTSHRNSGGDWRWNH